MIKVIQHARILLFLYMMELILTTTVTCMTFFLLLIMINFEMDAQGFGVSSSVLGFALRYVQFNF